MVWERRIQLSCGPRGGESRLEALCTLVLGEPDSWRTHFLEWDSKVQVKIGHLNVCVGASLWVMGLKPWVLSWWLCWCSWRQEEENLCGAAIPPPLLVSPEIQLTWGISLEKTPSLRTVALCSPFCTLIGHLFSKWLPKLHVMISSILCSSIFCCCSKQQQTSPVAMLHGCVGAATSKFKLNCPGSCNVFVLLMEDEPCSGTGFCRDEKAKETWGRIYALCVSVCFCGSCSLSSASPCSLDGTWAPSDEWLSLCLFWQLLWMQWVVYICVIASDFVRKEFIWKLT